MVKKLNARVMQKHDIEENWDKAINFVPLKGEIIVYDADYDEVNKPNGCKYPRIKIGDGILNAETGLIEGTIVKDLPFINDNFITNDEIDAICGANIYTVSEVEL